MKLIIQIPCYNEEMTLAKVINDLPRRIDGVDSIETLVINDGSTDRTEEVARKLKVDHVLSLSKRMGLAYAFKAGIEKALELGADIIVNTDGDNQYKADFIPALVSPIISGKAQMVIGCRNISEIKHFSILKKILQRIGSHVVRRFSNTGVPDATSGFRAFSREAAMRINVFSDYTYTLETLIQAGRSNLHILSIPVETNPKLRESRLMKSVFGYMGRSSATILRIYLMYEPLKFFFILGSIPVCVGSVFIIRFLYAHFTRPFGGGHIQSLLFSVLLVLLGFGIMMMGLLGDIISANRRLSEEILYKLKKSRK